MKKLYVSPHADFVRMAGGQPVMDVPGKTPAISGSAPQMVGMAPTKRRATQVFFPGH